MSILMPTSWYWYEVIGTIPVPPTACWVLIVVIGIGTLSPMMSWALAPSAIRSCGLARTSASLLFLMKLKATVGMAKVKSERPSFQIWAHGRNPPPEVLPATDERLAVVLYELSFIPR